MVFFGTSRPAEEVVLFLALGELIWIVKDILKKKNTVVGGERKNYPAPTARRGKRKMLDVHAVLRSCLRH